MNDSDFGNKFKMISTRTALGGGAALSAVVALAMTSTADATLRARLDAQQSAQAQTQAAAQQARAQAASVAQELHTAHDQNADATAAVLASIPSQVSAAVEAVKTKTDALYYKGVKITLGGFAEADSIYRSRDTANDLATSWNSIPFASTKAGHEDQLTFTGRQSRIAGLVEGNATPDIKLSYYGELDFQGAAQSANLNQSDSFNPRLREMYGALDFSNSGWHFLGGQNWSLATMNSKGITPRNEVQPMVIDSAYLPGYVYLRQPQFRVTKDVLNKSLWFAISVEEPQTIFTGSVPSNVVNLISNGSGYYGGTSNAATAVSAGGGAVTVAPVETCTLTGATPNQKATCVSTPTSVSVPTTATQSLNHLPDVIAKVAYELPLYGRVYHVEAFGLGRAFTSLVGTGEETVYAGGVGGGLLGPIIPGLLDVHASFLTGKGVGRYETSQLPDVTFNGAGVIKPIEETDFMAGMVLHPTRMLDIYSYAGEAHENRTSYNTGGTIYGYGYNTATSLAGCLTYGGSCSAATKLIEQINLGFWQRVYQGAFGRAQFGVEYDYTERHTFAGAGGIAPIANESELDVSFRYYPF
jgi:hypothetical protein